MNTNATVYRQSIRAVLPRIFSMLDREPASKTFGSADRIFWSWKFTDFSGARFQEIAYLLASLASDPTLWKDLPIQHSILMKWTKAAIHYWSTLQHRDGSFDEAYPYERSLAATAFTGFYVGQAFLKIRHAYTAEEQRKLLSVFEALADWLCRNDERHGILSNHLAAAAAAMHTVAEMTGEQRFVTRRDYFIRRIMQHQSDEGWFEEYGGADPGYQTHTIFYLAYIWRSTQDPLLLESLRRSICYFWHFVHLDGSIGGEYASRNTRFFMPAGFEILAVAIPEAAAVIDFMRDAIANESVVGLHAMDIYNIFPFVNNYLFAEQCIAKVDKPSLQLLPFHDQGVKHYEKSGHLVISTPFYQAIISTSKGGAFTAFSKQSQPAQCSNAGVLLLLAKGRKVSNQGLHCSQLRQLGEGCIEIESQFTDVNQVLMSPAKLIVFRLLSLSSIILPWFAYTLKNILVQRLVRRKRACSARLRRKINWDLEGISVRDEIILDKKIKVREAFVGGRFSAIHMGSSRYFEWQELAQDLLPAARLEHDLETLNQTGCLVIQHEWRAR